jgi:hypothetical protein
VTHIEVGTLAGRDNHLVNRLQLQRSMNALSRHDHALGGTLNTLSREALEKGHPSTVDELLQIAAELAARRELIGRSPMKNAVETLAAHRP